MMNQHTLPCFVAANKAPSAVVIEPLVIAEYEAWLSKQTDFTVNWLSSNNFKMAVGQYCLLPNEQGRVTKVIIGVADTPSMWDFACLPMNLPEGHYRVSEDAMAQWQHYALGWGLAAYCYEQFKASKRQAAMLVFPESVDIAALQSQLQAHYLVRDLINTPAEFMGPEMIAQVTQQLSERYQASTKTIVGDELLAQNFPAIHVVGRASTRPPQLIDLQWGDKNKPKVTLVGKGVCFDSGGLDIKGASNMLLMKKDMGGAAMVLGLASMIMEAALPVCLRVLIPTVDNLISGSAYKPGDVIATSQGLSVEVGNTDAEGRLILADALTEASGEKPEIIMDFATLTGAARVATGAELPAMFCNQNQEAQTFMQLAERVEDPVWQLPLYQPYRRFIDSDIADLRNMSSSPYGGAITAALFLAEFVDPASLWFHFDVMGYNTTERPGRPKGGEAMAMHGAFAYLNARFASAED